MFCLMWSNAEPKRYMYVIALKVADIIREIPLRRINLE